MRGGGWELFIVGDYRMFLPLFFLCKAERLRVKEPLHSIVSGYAGAETQWAVVALHLGRLVSSGKC